jgi:ABC-type branched-subunit amino acid transport system ATPase component
MSSQIPVHEPAPGPAVSQAGAQAGAGAPPVLSAEGVTVLFGGKQALSDTSITVGPGQIVGLLGPNGAGKSTLFNVMSGYLRPATGRVFLNGQDVSGWSVQRRARAGIGRTFQTPELFYALSARQHLALSFRRQRAYRAGGRGSWRFAFTGSSAEEEALVGDLLGELGLCEVADQAVVGLPLAIGRRIEVARALAAQPDVVLLDEPSSGLNGAELDALSEALVRANRDRGVSMLLVEHDVELVLRLSEIVHVLDYGRMIAAGPPEQIRNDPVVQSAYLGKETRHDAS